MSKPTSISPPGPRRHRAGEAIKWGCALALAVSVASAVAQPKAPKLPRITKVEIGANREFRVNGAPFLPIMGWLQNPGNFPLLKGIGVNTIAGYAWNESEQSGPGGTRDAAEYSDIAQDSGLYFVAPYMPKYRLSTRDLIHSRNVLAWIQEDEPDLPATFSDAQFASPPTLKINGGAPLANMVDGDPRSQAVLDPLQGAEFTIAFKSPVSIAALSIRGAPGEPDSPLIRDIAVSADGRPLLQAILQKSPEAQRFALPQSTTISKLTVKVGSTYPAKTAWGFISELQGLDAKGANVFFAPTRKGPQKPPAQSLATYAAIKAADPSRPVLMTLTADFIPDPDISPYSKAQIADLYGQYVRAADVPGFDVYPIYGYNRPERLDWVSQGVRMLRSHAGPRKPVFAWIEVQPGGNFGAQAKAVGPLEIRHEVYQAIICGATAIGYFTHQFAPAFTEFGVPPANQRALLQINQQLQRLAPVILGPDAGHQPKIVISGGLPAQLLAKQAGGELWIFAQTMDMPRRAGRATISVEGLKTGTSIEVVDENRRLTAQDGAFTDAFGPLDVHIYRLALAGL